MIRTLTHLGLALPAVLMAYAWRSQSLGVDPQKALILETGIWTFNLLLVVLVLPVASRWARWP
ncbi:MAG: sulfoxide reductase heme-binding subunit YedZ, partial [Pseudomonadota bacterium]